MAPAPSVAKKHEAKKVVNPLFEKRPKNFGIGEKHFVQTVLWRCRWCKRIFAILRTLQTTFHQDRWCTLRLLDYDLHLYVVACRIKSFCIPPQARIFSPSVIWHALWNGLVTFACRGSAPSSTSVWRFPLRSTSSPRPWTARPVSYLLPLTGCVSSMMCRLVLLCRWCERIFAI